MAAAAASADDNKPNPSLFLLQLGKKNLEFEFDDFNAVYVIVRK